MPYIDIEGEIPDNLEGFQSYQIYNCLDSAVTVQLKKAMLPILTEENIQTYLREKRVQQICLEISSQGFPVNQMALAELLWDLEKSTNRALDLLNQFCSAVDHPPLNPRSPIQVAEFFYKHLNLPTIYKFDAKTRKRTPSTDVKALEKLRSSYPIAMPFVNAILSYRETAKMSSVFKRGLEPKTFNLRCNYTPTGTETGRLSSQQNPYGRGTNAQNLTNRVRQVIHAPEDFCFLNVDLKTAESIAVGYISSSLAYIEACLGKLREDGSRTKADLHTTVAKLVWRELNWTDDVTANRVIADRPFYRHFSYRDMSKRGGHGTNYYGTPPTMASHLKVDRSLIESFQQEYFAAFPEIPAWHLETIARIQTDGFITTQLNRTRQFWGRPSDAATHREAIAFNPQSLVGDVMNEGLHQAMCWIKRTKAPVRVCAQVHDSALFIVPKKELADICPELQRELVYPVDFGPLGVMSIPTDAEAGITWCKKPKSGGNRFEVLGLTDYYPGKEMEWL